MARKLEEDKQRKLDEARGQLAALDESIDDLAQRREDAYRKLAEYKVLIAKGKANQGRDDPELNAKLKTLEAEARAIEKELNDIDARMSELKRKRNDAKNLLDDIKQNPNRFTPQ